MIQKLELVLRPEDVNDENTIRNIASRTAGISENEIRNVVILRRSIDARSRQVKIRVIVDIYVNEDYQKQEFNKPEYKDVSNAKQVIIIGSGPAGLFAALRLIELGIKPVIFERGKDVRSRRRDLAAINKEHTVNPESNYCFGEGGAGTYSDGKLYTRSSKRGDINRILEILVRHGAKEDIMVDAHPHIGTNKLPKLIAELRDSILSAGGEIHFNTKVTGLLKDPQKIKGVVLSSGINVNAEAVILATGHSARDIFEMLHQEKILIEAKSFALGVRVEHPQQLIDSIQYKCPQRGDFLPAASYALVHQVDGKGVYSFCMCPGGFIVPSATAPGEIVVNGMSPSKRDSRFANSGIVVSVEPADWQKYSADGALAALRFQQEVERKACVVAGGNQTAPASRLMDFVSDKISATLPDCSYQPGLAAVDMRNVLPEFIHSRLQNGFKEFGKKLRGYLTNEAIVVGVESRTSSPVRIPRDPITLQHTGLALLYPCGEGAGYAGGIISAAMDGEAVANACANALN